MLCCIFDGQCVNYTRQICHVTMVSNEIRQNDDKDARVTKNMQKQHEPVYINKYLLA